MISREYLYAQRCTMALIETLESLEQYAVEVGPIPADEAMVGLLLLWKMVSDEGPLSAALAESGIPPESLAANLRMRLCDRFRTAEEISPLSFLDPVGRHLDRFVWGWLDRARGEARFLGQSWVSHDHLLAALLAREDPSLEAILAARGSSRQQLRQSALARASQQSPPELVPALSIPAAVIEPPRRSLRELLGRPAVGVSRRFSLAMALAVITFYAVVLSGLRLLQAPSEIIVFWITFLAGVSLAQPLLFRGGEPRAAAILAGAFLMPLEIIVGGVYWGITQHSGPNLGELIGVALLTAPVGAVCGYLAGCLGAGLFFIAEQGHAWWGPEGSRSRRRFRVHVRRLWRRLTRRGSKPPARALP